MGGTVGEGTAEAGAVALKETEVTTIVHMAAAVVTVAGEAITWTATMTGEVAGKVGALAVEVAGAEAQAEEEGETGALLGKAVQREGLRLSNGIGKRNKENQGTRATTIIMIMIIILIIIIMMIALAMVM